jgi:hypothetical protein
MGAPTLLLQKNGGESVYRDSSALVSLADFMILTKYAGQVATGKKYGSRSLGARYARFLPMMKRDECDPWHCTRKAEAGFAMAAVCFAHTGAETAGAKQGVKISVD